ncbi:MAG: DUF2927 domain-containing protein [Lachnospiraceae bacterium]|nr:DUF2927 domain-containing protein [Lachnospiraceae bacterium]
MSKDAEKNEATENEVAENETAKKSNKQAVLLAVCILALALLLQCGYYVRIYLSRTIEIGPFANRRYGTIHAVFNKSSITPYIDMKISVPEGYTRAQAFYYFKEIALMDEGQNYVDTVRKWTKPIFFYVDGEPDELVEEALQNLIEKMNTVKGFPGITRVYDKEKANLIGCFYNDEDFLEYAHSGIHRANKNTFGMTHVETNESDYTIQSAIFYVRNSLSDVRRVHVTTEEMIQSLGLENDSYIYPDSLFFQDYSEAQELNALDWTVFRILYHPLIQPGMNFNQCFPILTKIINH